MVVTTIVVGHGIQTAQETVASITRLTKKVTHQGGI
jgi:hypothetical protein